MRGFKELKSKEELLNLLDTSVLAFWADVQKNGLTEVHRAALYSIPDTVDDWAQEHQDGLQ